MYKDGGLFSVSSTILITDMLKGSVPVELITGMVVMHAERYVVSTLKTLTQVLMSEKSIASLLHLKKLS